MKRELYLGEDTSKIPDSIKELTQQFTRALVAEKVVKRYSGKVRHSSIIISNDGFLEEGDIFIGPLEFEKKAIKRKGDMYYLDTTLLCGIIHRIITLPSESGDGEFLRSKAIRDAIDERIKLAYSTYQDILDDLSIDEETGVLLPGDKILYKDIVMDESIDEDSSTYEDIPIKVIDKYMRCIKLMDISIYGRINFGHKKVALSRKHTHRGIDYTVLEFNVDGSLYKDDDTYRYWIIRDRAIEEICENILEYNNAEILGDKLVISGISGVHIYDMSKVLSSYSREIVKSTRSIKARALGFNYKEVLYTNGDLREICTDNSDIFIPDKVKNILDSSVVISESNNRIVFGENIETCSTRCFINEVKADRIHKIQVEINCGGVASLNIIKSLDKLRPGKVRAMIKFNRDITPKEYAYAILCNILTGDILMRNILNDKFVLDTIKYIVDKRVKHQELLNNITQYERLKLIWDTYLKTKASEDLATKIDALLLEINECFDNNVEDPRKDDKLSNIRRGYLEIIGDKV